MELHPSTLRAIDEAFAPGAAEEARELRALDPPLVRPGPLAARIQIAAVLVSGESLTELREACRLAELDWRDLLVSAGLAGEDWPEVLRRAGLELR